MSDDCRDQMGRPLADYRYCMTHEGWTCRPGNANSEEFRVARNAVIDTRTQCGGPATGCEQDGEMAPGSFGNECVAQWIDHGPECPARLR